VRPHPLPHPGRRVAVALTLSIPLGLLTALPAAAAGAVVRPAGAVRGAPEEAGHGWVGTWAASPQQARPPGLTGPGDPTVTGFGNQTVREIVHISVGGTAVRVRLSNAYSSSALVVGQATAGVEQAGAALAAAPVPVTFHGREQVRIPAGGGVVSDPVAMRTGPFANLAVSLYLPQVTGPTTNHDFAAQANYISAAGDFAAQRGGQAFTQQAFSWFYLSGVDVRPAARAHGSLVTLGDSITDGVGSTTSANSRWPDVLAARLARSGRPTGVLNEGISGNRILNDSACFGVRALARLGSDVLGQSGVRDVILLEAINDIGFPTQRDAGCTAPNTAVTMRQITDGYRQIIARAHARGLKVIGATLTPIGGSFYSAASTEQEREAVNAWIRTSHAFDAVLDFDQVVRDPADPQRLLPAYDSGDHLHPSDAGYLAMGQSIDLGLLR
jgi:lysophospholipase L1-like esterase